MKALNLTTLLLTIIGGINWGLVGIANVNLVAAIFGANTGLERLIYVVVGLSALYQLVPFFRAWSIDEVPAERHIYR